MLSRKRRSSEPRDSNTRNAKEKDFKSLKLTKQRVKEEESWLKSNSKLKFKDLGMRKLIE